VSSETALMGEEWDRRCSGFDLIGDVKWNKLFPRRCCLLLFGDGGAFRSGEGGVGGKDRGVSTGTAKASSAKLPNIKELSPQQQKLLFLFALLDSNSLRSWTIGYKFCVEISIMMMMLVTAAFGTKRKNKL
jgi:hypothetical protein